MKRTIAKGVSLIIAVLLCLPLLPMTALAEEGDFSINAYGTLIAYHGPGGDVVIPDGVKEHR